MSPYRSPDVLERRNNAGAVKKAMLEKFRAVTQDPVLTEKKRAERLAIHEARLKRTAEREAAKAAREAELAEQAAREPNAPPRRNARRRKPNRS